VDVTHNSSPQPHPPQPESPISVTATTSILHGGGASTGKGIAAAVTGATATSTGTTTIPPVVDLQEPETTVEQEAWKITNWTTLQEKRLQLSRQRVALERRLFETAPQVIKTPLLPPPKPDPPISGDNNQNSDDLALASTIPTSVTVQVEEEGNGTWTGAVDANHRPHGQGKMIYDNGQVYIGTMVHGKRHTTSSGTAGTNTWPNGQSYTGQWVQNSRCGRGTHTWPDGKTVTGIWNNGHLQGSCFFQWPDGATYDGDTLHGKKSGRGIHTWADGRVYRGQYQQGYEHGIGQITEADGISTYRGHFKYGQRHGYGIQIWKEKTYHGEWAYNAVHGQGKLQWQTGARYTGHFQQGQYHGQGTYIDDTGRQYVGHWKCGQKHGYGMDTWPLPNQKNTSCTGQHSQHPQQYSGYYQDGRRHGYGKMIYSDGSYYMGGFSKNKKCGWGIGMTRQGTVVHVGRWDHDRPVGRVQDSSSSYNKSVSQDDGACLQYTAKNNVHKMNKTAVQDDIHLFQKVQLM
jgi:hypothetical protein